MQLIASLKIINFINITNNLKQMAKEKSCGTIVFNKDGDEIKYLILHYGEGHWDFSKGHVENNETEQQTALRELKEETGISYVQFQDGFREVINYYFRHEHETIYKEVIFFLAETSTEEVKISFEHVGYAWLSFEKALEKLTFRNAKDLLVKAQKFLSK